MSVCCRDAELHVCDHLLFYAVLAFGRRKQVVVEHTVGVHGGVQPAAEYDITDESQVTIVAWECCWGCIWRGW